MYEIGSSHTGEELDCDHLGYDIMKLTAGSNTLEEPLGYEDGDSRFL
jgi:hypothetical protein